jgi:hypothetical protein
LEATKNTAPKDFLDEFTVVWRRGPQEDATAKYKFDIG